MTVNANDDKNVATRHEILFDVISARNPAASNDENLLLFADVGSRRQFWNDDSSQLHRGLLTVGNPSPDLFGQCQTSRNVSRNPLDAATPSSVLSPTLNHFHPEQQEQLLALPSGIAGAVVGMLLGGPVVAAIAGFGSAYAVRKEGATGDVARALGEVALNVQATSREFEAKHHPWQSIQRAIQEADSKLALKAKGLAKKGWDSAVELNRQHDLLQRGVEGTGRGLEYVADKIQSIATERRDQQSTTASR